MVEMVTFVASWYDCMSKQSGYVQLSVREGLEKSVDRKDAFGFPAFRNYDLSFIVLFCLIALLFVIICCVQTCYWKWGVFEKQSMCICYASILDYRQRYGRNEVVCIRKKTISKGALACRRAGSTN